MLIQYKRLKRDDKWSTIPSMSQPNWLWPLHFLLDTLGIHKARLTANGFKLCFIRQLLWFVFNPRKVQFHISIPTSFLWACSRVNDPLDFKRPQDWPPGIFQLKISKIKSLIMITTPEIQTPLESLQKSFTTSKEPAQPVHPCSLARLNSVGCSMKYFHPDIPKTDNGLSNSK